MRYDLTVSMIEKESSYCQCMDDYKISVGEAKHL